ncbi:hypothetical protein ILUMI_01420, partial [Ignelater luminosus]
MKRKKRRIGSPYSGASVSQILAQREKLALTHPVLCKEGSPNPQFTNQVWSGSPVSHQQHPANRGYQENIQNPAGSGPNVQFFRYQNQDSALQIHHPHIIGPNGQVISVQGPIPQNLQQQGHVNSNQVIGNGTMIANGPNGIIIHGQNMMPGQPPQQKVFVNSQPMESNGPGRPNVQMVPVVPTNQQKQEIHQRIQQQTFCNQPFQYQGIMQQFDPNKNIRAPFMPNNCNMKPEGPQYSAIVQQNNLMTQQGPTGPILIHQQQKQPWQNRSSSTSNSTHTNQLTVSQHNVQNVEERVPPLHQHTPPPSVWPDDISRKKVKIAKNMKKRPFNLYENPHRGTQIESSMACPNIDVRQISNDSGRTLMINQSPQSTQDSSSPSFMEDPSGYLAQQTALLNSTISRQTGVNNCGGFICNSPVTSVQNTQMQHLSSSEPNEVPLPSNMHGSQTKQSLNFNNRSNQNVHHVNVMKSSNSDVPQQYNQTIMAKGPADSTGINEHIQCQGCIADHTHYQQNSQPSTPSSSNMLDDPVTSSTYSDKQSSAGNSPDSRPIQGGTISTSNVSPTDGSQSNPSTPNPHTPTTPQPRSSDTPQAQINMHISS